MGLVDILGAEALSKIERVCGLTCFLQGVCSLLSRGKQSRKAVESFTS